MKTVTTLLASLMLALGLSACDNGGESNPIQQQSAISDCGGYILDSPSMKSPMGDAATYCDAEMLHWSYDANTGTLSLANNRVLLNCCGDHSMRIAEDAGTYVITERDAPEGGSGRCDCMCVFDFTLEAQNLPAGQLPFRLVRNVTDGDGAQVVWQGDIDLAQGAGSITVDTTDVEPWCSGFLE